MKKSARTVSVILFAAALLSVGQSLVSCGDNSGDTPKTSDTEKKTEADTEEGIDYYADRLLVDDGVPTKDFQKRAFNIIACDNIDELILDEGTGEVIGDAVYKRTSLIEERFNVDITAVNRAGEDQKLKTSVMSGDDEYQLFSWNATSLGTMLKQDLYRNFYDIPHIDFSKPWWNPSVSEDLSYDGKCFIVYNYIVQRTFANMHVYFFNKQLAAEYDLPDMYELVNSGRWTADKQIELVKGVYRDLNGNGKQDDDDLYGYAVDTSTQYNNYIWAFGEKIVKKQGDGSLEIDYYNEKAVDIYSTLMKMSFETDGAHTILYNSPVSSTTMFMNNQVLFLPFFLSYALSLRNFEPDYGIIPYPKFDAEQKDYYTMIGGGCPAIAIPASIKDDEFVGSIIEVLEAESWKRIVPAYVDVALKVKGTRDQTSVEMLDYIIEHTVFDFGYLYCNDMGPGWWPQYVANGTSHDFSSYYAGKHKTYDKIIQKNITYFEDYDY